MFFLRLYNRFVLRALLREKTRSAVAVIGVALGVGVMVAIRLANSSVTETFRAAVDSVGINLSLSRRFPYKHGPGPVVTCRLPGTFVVRPAVVALNADLISNWKTDRRRLKIRLLDRAHKPV